MISKWSGLSWVGIKKIVIQLLVNSEDGFIFNYKLSFKDSVELYLLVCLT